MRNQSSKQTHEELLKSAKTFLGIKGKRRTNMITSAKFLNFIPEHKGKIINFVKDPTKFKLAVEREILKRYAMNNIQYSQTMTIFSSRKYKLETVDEYRPHSTTLSVIGTLTEINNSFQERLELELYIMESDSPFNYQTESDGKIIYKIQKSPLVRQSASLMKKNTKSGIKQPVNISKLFMKYKGAYKLDDLYIDNGDGWNLDNGTCVFDWLFCFVAMTLRSWLIPIRASGPAVSI